MQTGRHGCRWRLAAMPPCRAHVFQLPLARWGACTCQSIFNHSLTILQWLLLAHRPDCQGSVQVATPSPTTEHRWTNVPADLAIPMSVPGWAFQPFMPAALEEGDPTMVNVS